VREKAQMASSFNSTNRIVVKSNFRKYDVDESGSISAKELNSLCYDLGVHMDNVTIQGYYI